MNDQLPLLLPLTSGTTTYVGPEEARQVNIPSTYVPTYLVSMDLLLAKRVKKSIFHRAIPRTGVITLARAGSLISVGLGMVYQGMPSQIPDSLL